jgi:hypothetical protein
MAESPDKREVFGADMTSSDDYNGCPRADNHGFFPSIIGCTGNSRRRKREEIPSNCRSLFLIWNHEIVNLMVM